MEMLKQINTVLRMIKFSHTVFTLPFAIFAAFLAGNGGTGGFCGWGRLGLIILCMVFARSAAMTFNRIADAKIDRRNPRTANRALPAGHLKSSYAWTFFIVCLILFIASSSLFYLFYRNPWPMMFSVPVLAFICSYSYTKRFTWACHFWLGVSLLMAPVGAWVAIAPPTGPLFDATAFTLGGAVLLWTAGFDIIYAFQDLEVDKRDGLHSIPAALGVSTALWISRLSHSLAITLFLLLGLQAGFGLIYLSAATFTAVMLFIEHLLVRNGSVKFIKIAFGLINGLISIILAAAGIAEIMIT